jgi:hypothetical protein
MVSQHGHGAPGGNEGEDESKRYFGVSVGAWTAIGSLAAVASVIIALIALHGSGSVAARTTSPAAPVTSQAQTASAAATSTAAQGYTPPPTSAHVPNSPATGGPITGDWNVTYGAPATVTITLAGGMYTESAKTPVLVFPGTSCYIQPGIAIATFTQTGPGAYAGHARLWSENTCATGATTSVTLALSSDRNTLVASLMQSNPGMASTVILTRS